MTLISYESGGGDKGRCDSKCYNASRPGCHCICGGKNHGAGLRQAARNTHDLAEEWIEKYRAVRGVEKVNVAVNTRGIRPYLSGDLFEDRPTTGA